MKLTGTLPWALAAFGLTADACVLHEDIHGKRSDPSLYASRFRRYPSSRIGRQAPQAPQVDLPIGQGDRFKNGTEAPRGLGVDDRELDSILNVNEVLSGLRGLANSFDDVDIFTTPLTTYENRTVHGAVIGGNEPRVFIQSGIHARERGGPDNLLYFLADLLHAREAGTGVTYANRSYTHDDVTRALSAGIVFVPLINPDGVAYDQATNSCWRKNRNPESSSARTGHLDVGVDLNRNYDFLWNFTRHFNPSADLWAVGSDDPASDVFHGTAPLSEPETRNSAWVMARYASLSWFLDLHSFGGDVLYAWGDDDSQTRDPAQSFMNSTYDGKRGLLKDEPPNSTYGEYITSADLSAQERVADTMIGSMTAAGAVPYRRMPTVGLYPTSGGSTDYAMSAYYGRSQYGRSRCGVNRIQGLTIEFGVESRSQACPFYPDATAYRNSMRQVGAGLMELLLAAAGELGDAVTYECPDE